MAMPTEGAGPESIPVCGCSSPGLTDAAICFCGVEDLLRIIRRRYSLAVLNAINTHAPARFLQIEAALPQASTSTLAEMLHMLEVAGLIQRRVVTRGDQQPTYLLNPSGAHLLHRLRRLLDEVHGA